MNHQEANYAQTYNQKHKCKEIKHKQNAANDKTDDAVRMIDLIMCNEEVNNTVDKQDIHQYVNDYTDRSVRNICQFI